MQVHLDHGHRVVVVVRHVAGQHLEREDAERVEVAARVERQAAALLGRHVLRRAEHDAGLRLHAVALEQLRDREVEQLHEVRRARHVQQEHVVGLDVAVNDADRVRLGERRAALDQDLHDALRRHRSALERIAQRHAVEELHRHEQSAVLRLAEVEHADRVRMLQARARLRLVVEALDPRLIASHLLVQHLQRDDAVDRHLARLVDDAHAAFADACLDLVATVDDFADEGVLGHGGLNFTRGFALIWSVVSLTLPIVSRLPTRMTVNVAAVERAVGIAAQHAARPALRRRPDRCRRRS